MKLKSILFSLAALASLASCVKETEIVTYPRNEGEEYLNVDTESIEFLGRGGNQTFTVEASYDGFMEAEEWITLTACEFPGDKRVYNVTVTAEPNKTGEDRYGLIRISTPNLEKFITISQPNYFRPESPEVIKTAEELKYWLETCAPYCEEGEVMTLANDIDMKDVTIVPAEYFNGVLDGQGCSIRNLKSTSPLICTNNGVIRNLTIESSCSFYPDPKYLHFGPFASDNYGTITECVNKANVDITYANAERIYVGGIAGYSMEGSTISACTNYGTVSNVGNTPAANIYHGGIVGYAYGDFTDVHNYGPVHIKLVSASSSYQVFAAGITPRLETGTIKRCVNHKEAVITIEGSGKTGNQYVGGMVGYHEGTSAMQYCENYADITITLNNGNNYTGGLLGWQAKVTSAPFTLLEGSIVNCNMTGVKAAAGQYGNNPTQSVGLVLGRFAGQANNQVCNVGSTAEPIKVSGSIYCTATKTKVIANAKEWGALVDGDGSATNLNSAGSTWQVFNCVYEVVGDGIEGDPENLVVKTENVKLYVPADGGEASFIVKANYDAKISTECDWIELSDTTVAGDDTEHLVTVTAAANVSPKDREGIVMVQLPQGTLETVIISQFGVTDIPESLDLSVESLEMDPVGRETASFTVTANYDATITTDAAWLSLSAATVTGDLDPHSVTVTAQANEGEPRTATITVTLPKGLSKTIAVSQGHYEKPAFLTEIKNKADFLDFVSKAGDPLIYTKDITTKLSADIDLTGETLPQIANYIGTFDGQNHKITNWTSAAPLFNVVDGTVKNLVIDASCKITADPTLSNNRWGVIVGNLGSTDTMEAMLQGCVNNARVDMTMIPAAQSFIGGVVGRSSKAATVTGCTNNGEISIKPAGSVAFDVRLAGVIAGSNGSVLNCTNNAPVTYAPADQTKTFMVGGTVAYFSAMSMAGCVNTKNGKVSFTPDAYTGTAQSYVGGMLAYMDKPNTISNGKNFGDIKVTANHDKVAMGGLIGFIKAGDANNPNQVLDNCVVNCDIIGTFVSQGTTPSTNPLNSAGLVIGRTNGTDGVTAQVGNATAPIKAAGTISVNGGTSMTANAENIGHLALGAATVSTITGTSVKLTVDVVYEAVTKE